MLEIPINTHSLEVMRARWASSIVIHLANTEELRIAVVKSLPTLAGIGYSRISLPSAHINVFFQCSIITRMWMSWRLLIVELSRAVDGMMDVVLLAG
jgi:hypothetical protein